jgi:hypothetical protein
VVEVDDDAKPRQAGVPTLSAPATAQRSVTKAKLDALLKRYTEDHPEVKRLKQILAEEDSDTPVAVASAPVEAPVQQPAATPVGAIRASRPPVKYTNPVLESQLRTVETEISRHKEEQQRLAALVSKYQTKLEAIPVREQEITDLVRDYEISKAHYKQLLEKQLSAETATQLEIRQKGERFSVLDPAQPAERPSRPNRLLLNLGGAVAGLGLGLLLALAPDLFGMSITSPEQIVAATGIAVLEVIPVIHTYADRVSRRRRVLFGTASVAVLLLVCGALLAYRYRDRIL